jgi:uncharacterized spore protein YtfJ
MRLPQLIDSLLHARRVFGEPVQQGDLTVVPVARVAGCTCVCRGRGNDTGPEDAGHGRCGSKGSGLRARTHPVGVYVIDGKTVTWHPAFDLTRVALRGQFVGALAILAIASVLRRRR